MKNEKLYYEIIENLCDGVYFVDPDRQITFWNKAAEDITGYKREEIVGKRCQNNLLNHIDREGRPLCSVGCPLHATTLDGKQRRDEVFLRHKEGHRLPIVVNIFPIKEDDQIVGAVEIFTQSSPIVYEDNLIEKLSNMAMNDQLTGLSNRRKMESYLDYRLRELKRFQRKFCVIFLDIDNFSGFNNKYGHETGDSVLINVSKSIGRSIRTSDLFGRWGGEEFVGVLEIKKDDEAIMLAEKIRVLISGTEIMYNQEQVSVTASLGVTIARDDDTIETVVGRADSLMYESKNKNKNCVSTDI